MQTESDVDRIVRSWLREDSGSANRLVADVMARLDAAPQRFTVAPSRTVIDLRAAALFAIAIAVAVVVVIAVVDVNWLPSTHVIGGPSASASPPSTFAPSPITTAIPLPTSGYIDPGTYVVTRPEARVLVTLPDGWSVGVDQFEPIPSAGSVHKKNTTNMNGRSLTLGHDVTSVTENVCVAYRQEREVPVGPTAHDLVAALMVQIGMEPSEAIRPPTEVTVGGYPATHFELTCPVACPGPEGRSIWVDRSGPGAGILKGGVTTVDVVDVGGVRLVITSRRRATTVEEDTDLEAILRSIQIEGPTATPPTPGITSVVRRLPASGEIDPGTY